MKKKLHKSLGYMALTLMTIVMFIPLYSVFVMGTYYSEEIFKGGLPLWFSDYFTQNLQVVMQKNYGQAYLNSLFVSLLSVALSVSTSVLIGYAVAKFSFRLRNFLQVFLIISMMIPQQIMIIGYVREMRSFGLMSSLWPLAFVWMAHPFGAFFMSQFIRDAVPTEVMESARIDGCSEPRTLLSIVVPFIRPAILTVSLLVFLWSWNSFMIPLIIINKQALYTIPLMVSTLSTVFRTDYGAIMCALSISILPIIVVFCFCSKNFVQGIANGAVKG